MFSTRLRQNSLHLLVNFATKSRNFVKIKSIIKKYFLSIFDVPKFLSISKISILTSLLSILRCVFSDKSSLCCPAGKIWVFPTRLCQNSLHFCKFSHKIEKFRQNKIDKNNIIFYRFFLSISIFYRFFGLIDNYRFIDFFYRKKNYGRTRAMSVDLKRTLFRLVSYETNIFS